MCDAVGQLLQVAFKTNQASEKQALETLGDTWSCLQLSTTKLSHTEQDESSKRVEYALVPGLSETTWKGCTILEEFASPQRSIRSRTPKWRQKHHDIM
jgi:hypothetical protein